MSCKETNLYYFQNKGNYGSSSEELKWVDVSVPCATHKKISETRYICKFCVVSLHKEECFERDHSLKHYYESWCFLKKNFRDFILIFEVNSSQVRVVSLISPVPGVI
jgi:hypothetical protein